MLEAKDKLGLDVSYNEELAMLNNENEMLAEELRAMYAGAYDESIAGSELN